MAKEFASTIPWIRDNLLIVVPTELMASVSDMIAPEGTSEVLYKYVTIDADEIPKQATWEIDMLHTERPARQDEVIEYEVANWNSMFCPQWFPPTVLHPWSNKWKVKAIIHQSSSEGPRQPVLMNVHPNKILPVLAQ